MGRIINVPYWIAGQRSYATYGFAPADVDVAIIGGGLYGLAVMHWLSRLTPGNYLLLEKGMLGARNSLRSIGAVNTVPDGSVHVHGLDVFLDRVKLARENKKLINQFIDEISIDCGFIQNGGIHVAVSEDQVAQLEVIQRHLVENDFACEPLDSKEIIMMTGGAHFLKGLYYPGDMVINPYTFLMLMAETCAQIETNNIVQEFNTIVLREHDDYVEVVSDTGGIVKAKRVVICNNELAGIIEPSIITTMSNCGIRGSQVIVTDKISDIESRMQLSCRSVSGMSAWTYHNNRIFNAVRNCTFNKSLDYYGYNESALKISSMFLHKHFGHYLHNVKRAFLWTDHYVNMPGLLPIVKYKDGSDRIIINAGYDYSFMDLFFVVANRIATAIVGKSDIDLLGGKHGETCADE